MNKLLTIDLIICTYNNASLLDRTLMAITQQVVPDWIDWRVIIINNNCSDNTDEVFEKYQKLDLVPHLSIVRETTQGLTPARQCGVQHTSGDWLAFIDDDCFLAKDWVENAANFAVTHPDCGAFGGKVDLLWEKPPEPWILNFAYSFAKQDHGDFTQPVSCLVGAGMVINRAVLAKTKWLDKALLEDRVGKKLISGGDVEIALRLSAQAPLWYDPKIQLKHFIPAYRTTSEYLMRINYGLGSSSFFGNSMVWSGSYYLLIMSAMLKVCTGMAAAKLAELKASVRGRPMIEPQVTMYFMRGYGAAIKHMVRMDYATRKEILGCAVSPSDS
ncbi:glycosyltransferase [Leptolyngbya sp. BC1307]|uniref:glycosyltransferase n=1 Tax=Leptolyngbya sp. BC1307 TaxID=2029589 RepID=UPI000EFA66B4|nr:glycosyltransferase [Leptolyngbya sp. BC1307]